MYLKNFLELTFVKIKNAKDHQVKRFVFYLRFLYTFFVLLKTILFSIQMCTMDDHHQEVIAYCREYGFHGLLADDAEYAAFDPPRYFSAENLKLTYKVAHSQKKIYFCFNRCCFSLIIRDL